MQDLNNLQDSIFILGYKGHVAEWYIETMPLWKFKKRLKQLQEYNEKLTEEMKKDSKQIQK